MQQLPNQTVLVRRCGITGILLLGNSAHISRGWGCASQEQTEESKMTSVSDDLPIVVIACNVFQDMLEELLPKDLSRQVSFFDLALHVTPKKMRRTLQEAIDSVEKPSLIVLAYGLCGNGLGGVRAGEHVLLIPRVDDCIAIMLGSRQAYQEQFHKEPGTYYLGRGWLEADTQSILPGATDARYGADPLTTYESYVTEYGPETAEWLMDQMYRNYKRLAFVAHTQAEIEKYRPRAHEIARFCERWGMRYEEILGSDRYVRRLIEVAVALDRTDGDFLVIPPGGEIRQEQFQP
jgi:hypothetical protein